MKTVRINPDGTTSVHDLDFHAIGQAIDGWIEARYTDNCVLLFDEEGNMKQLDFNPAASVLGQVGLRGVVFAVGDRGSDFGDLSDEAVARIVLVAENVNEARA